MYISFKTPKGQASLEYEGLIDTKTGNIIARSIKPVREKQLHLRTKINNPPCTDADFIVCAARKAYKEAMSK